MKKIGVILFFILLFSVFVFADTNDTNTTNTTGSALTTISTLNSSTLDEGYSCLESKVKGRCSSLSVSEIAFTLLSNPSADVTSECKSALLSKKSAGNCWPSGGCTIKDTSLAILALNNLGEDTQASQNWLKSNSIIPSDMQWYLEEDSNNATQCKISYSGNDYTINVADTKKIDSDAGSCLTRAQSNFWLQVSSSCYNKNFSVTCNNPFISTLLYKYTNSPTIYISSDTKSAGAFGSTSLSINAKCFGLSSCDYEGSLWATEALIKTGNSITNYLPYLIAGSESNKRYLPNSFIYMVTAYEDYGSRLVAEQRLGNYWEADLTPNNRFYDTALALLSLRQSSATQVANSRLWFGYSQDTSGCWNSNNIKDTAIVLWALTDRSAQLSPSTGCQEAGFYCTSSPSCSSSDLLSNYYCSGLSVCCKTQQLKSCSEYSGQVCPSGKICSGNEIKSTDADYCCIGTCNVAGPTTSACESSGYICKDSCSSNQDQTSLACDSGICCKPKPTPTINWFLWTLIILILIVLAIIAYLMRDKIKLWWFKFRSKVKSSKPGPSQPPAPAQYPMRPMPPRMIPGRPAPARPLLRPIKKDDETFRKLREMSK